MVWDTLVGAGISAKLDPEQTITPSAYRHAPRVLPRVELEHLPLIPIAEDGAGTDLVLGPQLGRGGMGTVHTARQRSLDRDVAVKRLRKVDPENIEALVREAQISGSLEHPNIVPVHALGRDAEGAPVLVMKQIEGDRWAELLPPPPDWEGLDGVTLGKHLRILSDVCNAVHYAHSRGIVHRDIKPQNVLIGRFGEVMLVDWGVAVRVGEPATGRPLGTPGYMAPEMAAGGEITPRTDVYLLGATLHRVLVGASRHKRRMAKESLLAALQSEPHAYASWVPADLAAICNRACAKEPGDRFASALELREALETHVRHRSSHQLCRVATARVQELEALLQEDDPDLRTVQDLASACRFGLDRALEEWPENTEARAQLARFLSVLVPWQLQMGRLEAAAEALKRLRKVTGEGHEALATRVEDELRRARALAKLGKELDMSVGSGWRTVFLVGFAAVAAVYGACIVLGVRMGWLGDGHGTSVGVATGSFLGIALVLLVLRRSLLRTVANRRLMYTLWATSWAVLLHRVVSWWGDVPVEQVYVTDLLIMSLAASVAGLAIDLRVLWIGLSLIGVAAVAAWVPWLSLEILSTAIVVLGLYMAGALWHWMR